MEAGAWYRYWAISGLVVAILAEGGINSLPMQAAAAVEQTVTGLAGNTPVGTDVYVSGDQLVWVFNEGSGDIGIKYRNITSGEEKTIASGVTRKQSPTVSGSTVVWSDKGGNDPASADWDICSFNMETGERKTLNVRKGQHVNPSIDGNNVVWFDMEGFGVMYAYDLSRNQASAIGQGRYPMTSQGKVVYKNARSGGLELYDLRTNQVSSLYKPGGGQFVSWFTYNGAQVLWKEGNSAGESKVVLLESANPMLKAKDLTAFSRKNTEYSFLSLGEGVGAWLEAKGKIPTVLGVNLATGKTFTVVELSEGKRVLGCVDNKLLIAAGDGSLSMTAVTVAADGGQSDSDRSHGGSGAASGGASPSQAVEKPVGLITALDEEATLSVPDLPLSERTSITLKQLEATNLSVSTSLDPRMSILGRVWEIGSERAFSKPALLSIKASMAWLPSDSWHKAAVYCYDEDKHTWIYVGGSLDQAKQWFTASVTMPGIYALLVNDVGFSDLDQHWARQTIEALAARSIVDGVGNGQFAPDSLLTRAQFVKLLVNANRQELISAASSSSSSGMFTDVPASHWAYPWIEAASRAGLVEGQDAQTFAPDQFLTREQMMAVLIRAAGLGPKESAMERAEAEQELEPFGDKGEISHWALSYTALAVTKGWIEGANGMLQPSGFTTRAEAATVIYRLLQQGVTPE